MKKRFLSIITVLALVMQCFCIPALAADTSGGLTAKSLNVLPYTAASKNGIDVIFELPDETVTGATVTLYNSADDTVVTDLAESNGTSTIAAIKGNTNPAVFSAEDLAAVKYNSVVGKSFYGLDNTKKYYVKLELTAGDKTGTQYVRDITPGYSDIDGYAFGREVITHTSDGTLHDMNTLTIDKTTKHSGTSSLRVHSYGYMNEGKIGESGSYKHATRLWFNTLNLGAGTYEWKLSYKGQKPYRVGVDGNNATAKHTSAADANGWITETYIVNIGSSGCVVLDFLFKSMIGDTWIDSMTVKKINDYNAETGEYTSVDSKTLLMGGGFDTEVDELAMYTPKVLTWSVPEGALFNALNIYKDGTLIDTIKYDNSFYGVTTTSYTIKDADWDISSEYTVKAIPASGGANPNAGVVGTQTKESEGVSVKGISALEIVSYDGAKPVELIANSDSTSGVIDAIWNMPQSSKDIMMVKAELIDGDGDALQTNYVTAAAGQRNVHTSFKNLTANAEYDVKVTIIYADATAGVATAEDVVASHNMRDFGGMVFGAWMHDAAGSNFREIYNISYDTTVKKTGTGSAKIDLRGFVKAEDDTFTDSAQSNNFVKMYAAVPAVKDSYYEISVTYKTEQRTGAQNGGDPSFMAGNKNESYTFGRNDRDDGYMPIGTNGEGDNIYTATETDEDGWTTTKALVKAKGTNLYAGVLAEYSARKLVWIDNYSICAADYDAETKSYTVTGDNIIAGGNFSYDVTDAEIDDSGIITWNEIDSKVIKEVRIYDSEGKIVDTQNGGVGFTFIDNSESKDYVIKVLTHLNGYSVSRKETKGVAVKKTLGEKAEIGSISLERGADNKVSASVSVKNNALDDFNACLILAVYSGTKLEGIWTDPTTVVKGAAAKTLGISDVTVDSGKTVKAMLWRGLASLEPLTASVSK